MTHVFNFKLRGIEETQISNPWVLSRKIQVNPEYAYVETLRDIKCVEM